MTNRRADLTVRDKLLLAALSLEQDGRIPFTAEDLVVNAWSMFPRSFGLKGYVDEHDVPRFPDSNRVFAEIMGSKPLRKLGLLVKVGQKTYVLTESGRTQAENLHLQRGPITTESQDTTIVVRSTLRRENDRLLHRMLSSRATRKVQEGDLSSLSFFDACVFWAITPQISSVELDGKLTNVRSVIEIAKKAIADGDLRTASGTLSASEIEIVESTQRELEKRFRTDLEAIRERGDQKREAKRR